MKGGNNIFRLSNNFKRKMFKYDLNSQNIIAKDIILNDFLKNRKILLVYPYPSKERINSELYDDILIKLKIAKEIQDENTTNKTHNQRDFGQEKMEQNEIYKTKFINELDDIVGLSELDEKNTEEYVKKIRVPDVWFIVDELNYINKLNKFEARYEMLINDLKIQEYRPDPSLGQNIYLGFVFVYLTIAIILLYLNGYANVFKNYLENENKDELINSAIKI